MRKPRKALTKSPLIGSRYPPSRRLRMSFTRKESFKDHAAHGDSWPAEYKNSMNLGCERVAINEMVLIFSAIRV